MDELMEFLKARADENEQIARAATLVMRKIIDDFAPKIDAMWRACDVEWGQSYSDPDGQDVLKLLALPYADHPDYREEWRTEDVHAEEQVAARCQRTEDVEEPGQPVDWEAIVADRERMAKRYGERARHWQSLADAAEALLRDLVDPDPCEHFDHHGYCQTHGAGDPCPHARAREWLAALGQPPAEKETQDVSDDFQDRGLA
jgi:hypothetical protein